MRQCLHAQEDLIADPDRKKAGRAAEEMLKQVKFDIARLERAFKGTAAAGS